jgi:hypothetical protein
MCPTSVRRCCRYSEPHPSNIQRALQTQVSRGDWIRTKSRPKGPRDDSGQRPTAPKASRGDL